MEIVPLMLYEIDIFLFLATFSCNMGNIRYIRPLNYKFIKLTITLNSRPEEFDADELTVADIMRLKSFHFKLLVVKLNGALIDKDDYASALVRTGDDLMIIHLVSGG